MTEAITHLKRDAALANVIDDYGELRLDPAEDTFERLVRSIISQQVSTASARAIRTRVFERFEIAPEPILAADSDDLKAAGLSRQKAEYVQNVAHAYVEHGYSNSFFEPLSDDEVIDELTEIRGVGVWTAKMFLMFSLGREDVFPVEDLGVRNGMAELVGEELSRAEIVDRAEPWRPYRSIASLYLWRLVD